MPYKDKEKQRRYQREWVRARRVEWIAKNGPCKCGSWLNLQVDHIDPTKKISHNVWSWSKERREKELEKCQILCYKCHVKKTWKGKHSKHGTMSRYTSRACRCILCRQANTKYRAIWRKKTGKH